jgi:hypothetical protein
MQSVPLPFPHEIRQDFDCGPASWKQPREAGPHFVLPTDTSSPGELFTRKTRPPHLLLVSSRREETLVP